MMRTIAAAFLACCVWLAASTPAIYSEENCPESSNITELISSSSTVEAAGPFDFSNIKSGGAMLKKNGTMLGVYLSNREFTVAQMENSFIVPIKENGVFIVGLNFSNAKQPIVPGTYSAAAGYGKPLWVSAEIKVAREDKGSIVSLGVREGTATIIKMTDNSICGTFDLVLRGKDAISSALSGSFNVPLEKSSW